VTKAFKRLAESRGHGMQPSLPVDMCIPRRRGFRLLAVVNARVNWLPVFVTIAAFRGFPDCGEPFGRCRNGIGVGGHVYVLPSVPAASAFAGLQMTRQDGRSVIEPAIGLRSTQPIETLLTEPRRSVTFAPTVRPM
jgi:hypothetical protein